MVIYNYGYIIMVNSGIILGFSWLEMEKQPTLVDFLSHEGFPVVTLVADRSTKSWSHAG